MESMLSVCVIIATCAGLGMVIEGKELAGLAAWNHHYMSWGAAAGLGAKVSAFVEGSANMLSVLGIPLFIGVTIMGVFVASFAGTSLDTATRLQRYVITELAESCNFKFLTGKYTATTFAVITGGLLACGDGKGKGGLMLWPLFGGSNQLLACLALLVITVYLVKKGRNFWLTLVPFLFMLVMTTWALVIQLGNYFNGGKWHLLVISVLVMLLELWMIIEAGRVMKREF